MVVPKHLEQNKLHDNRSSETRTHTPPASQLSTGRGWGGERKAFSLWASSSSPVNTQCHLSHMCQGLREGEVDEDDGHGRASLVPWCHTNGSYRWFIINEET